MQWIIIFAAIGYLAWRIIEAVHAAQEEKAIRETIRQNMLSTLKPIGEGLFKARENGVGRWAILNADRQPITPFKYLNVYRFFNGMVAVDWLKARGEVYAGYVDKQGREVIPCQYDTAYPFRENGLAYVKQNRKWGIIDRTGAVVVPFQWDVLDLQSNCDYDRVKKDGKYGLVGNDGQILIPALYDTLYPNHRGYSKVEKDGLWGVISHQGDVWVPVRFTGLRVMSPDRYFVEENGKWGIWDRTAGQIQPCVWDEVGPGTSGLIYVKKDGRYGMIDETGDFRMDYLWTDVDFDYSGQRCYQRVAIGDLWARLNSDCTYQWEEPERFAEGVATVHLKGMVGQINENGSFVSPLCPEPAEP